MNRLAGTHPSAVPEPDSTGPGHAGGPDAQPGVARGITTSFAGGTNLRDQGSRVRRVDSGTSLAWVCSPTPGHLRVGTESLTHRRDEGPTPAGIALLNDGAACPSVEPMPPMRSSDPQEPSRLIRPLSGAAQMRGQPLRVAAEPVSRFRSPPAWPHVGRARSPASPRAHPGHPRRPRQAVRGVFDASQRPPRAAAIGSGCAPASIQASREEMLAPSSRSPFGGIASGSSGGSVTR